MYSFANKTPFTPSVILCRIFQNDCFHAFEKFAKASWIPAVSFWPTRPVYCKIHWNAFAVESKCFTISAASIAFFSLVLRRTITAGWLEAHGVKVQSVTSNSKPCVTENTEWIQFSAGCFNFFQLCMQNIVLFVQVDGEGSEKNHWTERTSLWSAFTIVFCLRAWNRMFTFGNRSLMTTSVAPFTVFEVREKLEMFSSAAFFFCTRNN